MGTFGDEYIYVPTEREGLDDGHGRRKTHETGFSHCGSTGSLALAACASTSSDTASVASRRCNDIGPSASSASSVSAGRPRQLGRVARARLLSRCPTNRRRLTRVMTARTPTRFKFHMVSRQAAGLTVRVRNSDLGYQPGSASTWIPPPFRRLGLLESHAAGCLVRPATEHRRARRQGALRMGSLSEPTLARPSRESIRRDHHRMTPLRRPAARCERRPGKPRIVLLEVSASGHPNAPVPSESTLLSYEEVHPHTANSARPVEAAVAQLLPTGKKLPTHRCSQPAPHRR